MPSAPCACALESLAEAGCPPGVQRPLRLPEEEA